MAKRCIPDKINKLLYVEHGRAYRGYLPRYLSQHLTEIEASLLTCVTCRGLIRDASSCQGEIVCLFCANGPSMQIVRVTNSISNLRIKCPLLRDCEWSGRLREGKDHLKECDSFLTECLLKCGDVMKRCEQYAHLRIQCSLRKVQCKFCRIIIINKELAYHLKICPAHPIICICDAELRRCELIRHIETVCGLTEVECPYAKYSCKIGKILRKDLLAHKEERYIEHQDMIEQENCKLKEEQVEIHNQSVQGQGQLELKYDQMGRESNDKFDVLAISHCTLQREHCKLKEKHGELVHKHECLNEELTIRKPLDGGVHHINFRTERTHHEITFKMGAYDFKCSVRYEDKITIYLTRMSSSSPLSDKNIICITNCVLHFQANGVEPSNQDIKVSKKIHTRETIQITELTKEFCLKYSPGTLGTYFDHDYITYKYF